MVSEIGKLACFYHHPCNDGFASFKILSDFWKDRSLFVLGLPASYNNTDEQFEEQLALLEIEKIQTIYVLDFSFSSERWLRLFALGKSIIWIDHHKSAIELFDKMVEEGKSYFKLAEETDGEFDCFLSRDNTASGAALTWEYLLEGKLELPDFYKQIADWDLWKKTEETDIHHAFLSQFSFNLDDWQTAATLWQTERELARASGKAILNRDNQNCRAIQSAAIFGTYSNNLIKDPEFMKIAVCNVPWMYQSTVGNNLVEADSSLHFAVLWFMNKHKQINVSFRSRGDKFDCSKIAKIWGGGGHKNAAGCNMGRYEFLSEFASLTFEKQNPRIKNEQNS